MTPDQMMQRSDTIRARVRADLVTTLRVHLGKSFAPTGELLDALAEDAMHHVDQLIAETGWVKEGGNMVTCPSCGSTNYYIGGSQ